MRSDLMFVVDTERKQQPVTGLDSMIVEPPAPLIPMVGGIPGVVVPAMKSWLRRISDDAAGELGETLHHAVWTLTGDPFKVATIGLTHDCSTCRDGVQVALGWMEEHPDSQVLAGLLYWTEGDT